MSSALQAIVIEYRSPQRTITCIEALLEQNVSEVIVVDNSADEGLTRSVLEDVFSGNVRIQILDAGRNLGFAAGVNFGLRFRTSERVLLINNDAVPRPGALEALSAGLDADADACIAYPSLLHNLSPISRVFYHRWLPLVLSHAWHGAFEVPRGCCMLIAFDRTPAGELFDERFFMYGEEIALGWRIFRAGSRMLHVKQAWVDHEGSASAVRGSSFYEEHTARAHLVLGDVLAKGWLDRWLIMSVRLPVLFMRAFLRALRQLSGVPMRSFFRMLWNYRRSDAR